MRAADRVPAGVWAELECAFLNTYQARWQYLADTLGAGFAQGKTMLWRRAVLQQAGGIEALARDLAEDAAATKVVDAQGLRVRLVDAPFGQPLGYRGTDEVWNRQVRWARLRRASFPACYLPELLTGAPLPLLACGLVAAHADLPVDGLCARACDALVWRRGAARPCGALAPVAAVALRLDAARSPVAGSLGQWLAPAVRLARQRHAGRQSFPFSSAR